MGDGWDGEENWGEGMSQLDGEKESESDEEARAKLWKPKSVIAQMFWLCVSGRRRMCGNAMDHLLYM